MIKAFCKYRAGKVEGIAYLIPGAGDEYLSINVNIEKGLVVAAHLNFIDNLDEALGYIKGWLECDKEIALSEYDIKKTFNVFFIAIKNEEAEYLGHRHYFMRFKKPNH